MTDIPGMIIWTGDYLADTTKLTMCEHGAYLLILMAMWRNGGKLSNSSTELAMIAHARPEKWRQMEEKIMSFMTLVEGSDGKEITQKRLQLEYQLAQSRNQKRVAAGILGGTAKALKYKKSGHNNASGNGITSPHNTNSNIIKDSFNSELRQETRWVSTKRIGSRLFKVGEMAPAYDGQPPDRWKTLRPEDCK